MSKLKTSVILNHPKDFSASLLKETFRPPVGMFNKKRVHVFSPEETLKTPATKEDFLSLSTMESTSNFPGNTCCVAAQEAMQHIKRNFITFQKIFTNFNIPESDYQLLAGFDEDLIRGRLGYLNQIHILLRSEPQDMVRFLLRLSHVLGNFTAVIFTNKSTYRLPSAPEEFHKIARANTFRTAYELSTLSRNVNTGGSFNIGRSSGQGNNGRDDLTIQGEKARKETQRILLCLLIPARRATVIQIQNPLDQTVPMPRAPSFCSVSPPTSSMAYLFKHFKSKEHLRLRGHLNHRTPPQFATCIIEFTELRTTNMSLPRSENQKYYHFQLDVRIDAKEDEFVYVSKTRPLSTPEYNPEAKVSKGPKKIWNILVSGTLSLLPPKATIGSSRSRTGEQSTNTERIVNASRIMYTNIRGVTQWIYHLVDRFEQNSGFVLSPEKLPFVHITFGGHEATPPPPNAYLNVEISTYWTILSPPGGSAWIGSGNTPTFSNLCKTITLDLPKDLQGSHLFIANLLVDLDTKPIIPTVTSEVQGYLGTAIVAETNHTANI